MVNLTLTLLPYLTLLTLLTPAALAQTVKGSPEGFATGTTGGGSATPQYPADIAQLKTWLTDSTPRVIVINKEFNFIGSEGKVTEQGCRPASNKCVGNGGQDAINGANWCSGQPAVSVTYDKAGVSAINVGSNKSIVGVGSSGVIRGKGLRIANGAKNVIIQNIHITDLNPQYIWGGDAITLAGSDLVWIDHVKISKIGRQMFVTGPSASGRVTVSNTDFDGTTSYSATCNGRHYWTIYLTGSSDQVTFKNNYIHNVSGRAPKVLGGVVLHAVNNYFYSIAGHAFDVGTGGNVLAEGNIFQNVDTVLLANPTGQIFASPDTTTNQQCSPYLGHACQLNAFGSSGSFPGTSTSFFGSFSGKPVAGANSASGLSATIVNGAGVGKI
ncbi:pectin lyase A precursor [Peziza echinospora]|nr:pectin lyase A precursor [Peziza echinospora]